MANQGKRAQRAKDDFDLFKQKKTFAQRRDSFVRSNDLPLRSKYHQERDVSPHMYPGKADTEVLYMDSLQRQQSMANLHQGFASSPDLMSLQGNATVTDNKNIAFARQGGDEHLTMMQKDKMSKPQGGDLRVNHSSFNQGGSVANAGFLEFGGDDQLSRVRMQSGHYRPDSASAVKLAMWAEQGDKFDSAQVPIVDFSGKAIDVGHARQVKTVNDWAQSHPKSARGRSKSV